MEMHLGLVDYSIIAIYFAFVLGIGFWLRSHMKTSEDFFLSGRSIPGWVTGLAFMSANLGALEVLGYAANAAKYGAVVTHFYWLGAIPAMCFVGVFMMPFYYGSKARSVPEFLRLRYDEKTRTLNAGGFAILTLLVSGIDLYAMALLFQQLLHWPFFASVVASATVVAAYILLGGLTSSIYNEVLQFFLIVFGFLPMTILGLKAVGGFLGLNSSLESVAVSAGHPAGFYDHVWANLGHASNNPLGVNWIEMTLGLGFVLSFGYWCTDFLVVQRALAAKDMAAAERTPLIAAVPKMFFPALVILPGLVAIGFPEVSPGFGTPPNFNLALPLMLQRFYPSGLLGIGMTALLASFMSGMAGNVTAFNTVWTYDIYQTHINPGKPDRHYLMMGRVATIVAVVAGVLTAFIVLHFNNLMDYLQALFSIFNAPLFATFLLGMFWKRTTGHGAFWGLLCGLVGSTSHYVLYRTDVIRYYSPMGANFFQAMWAFGIGLVVTVVVTLMTKPRPESELVGLVYSLTPRPELARLPWYQRPGMIALGVLGLCLILNIIFW
ncbi:MAG TPA: sodium:solute symporter family protein [Terriglobia bacterium]|nr:sodium:solute symporter family protein [Terriglobia bacterium]